MNSKASGGVFGTLEKFAERFNSPYLVVFLGGLFFVDLLIPDPIFLLDEIFLGLLTILVARWQSRSKAAAADAAADPAGPGHKPPPKNVTPER